MGSRVIVVGAGPVGLALAGELRVGGAEVTVLERLAAPTTESRATTLDARTMELLDERGLLAPLGTVPREPRGHFGGLPLDLGGQPSPFAGQWKVPQARVEALLGGRARELGADIRREHEVCALHPAADGVGVEAVVRDGRRVRLTAEYVVGCDGEESTVGALAGFEFPGRDARRELLRCDVRGVDIPDRRFQRLPGGFAVAATREGLTRVMVHEYGRAPAVRTAAPGFDEVVAAWSRVTGEDISGGTPVWVNAFGDVSRQAAQYRRGRVLLAGDAAHRHLPVGGQAINLGLQDAFDLGWKLAAEVAGTAPAGLLDSYHEERHRAGRRAMAVIDAQALVMLGGPEIEPVRSLFGELLGHRAVRELLASRLGGLDAGTRGLNRGAEVPS
ncbi:oxygenase [Streptomyces puniciscabiei]|uniref:Oxygenase n=1 Tax=Streptomyces puniciscabiei TaxID=164348 RepID=A0A542SXH7_9ACTN|nr:FAD-dependent monooxygenase [Streptomyces puniciscabiei]TQK79299.1 oxygenase [Streptomyces puniciscabiei]